MMGLNLEISYPLLHLLVDMRQHDLSCMNDRPVQFRADQFGVCVLLGAVFVLHYWDL